ASQAVEGRLQGCLLRFNLVLTGVTRNVDRLADKDSGARERPGNLQAIPAWQFPVARRDNMKWQDGLTGVSRQRHGTGLGLISRAARAVNREGDIHTVQQTFGHLRQCSPAAARRRAARRAVAKPLDEA